MANGKIWQGRQGWCIQSWQLVGGAFTLEATWRSLSGQGGRFVTPFACEHNSVGACTIATLEWDGYLPWGVNSRVLEVFTGTEPILANRIFLGRVGLVTSTESDDGTRTTTIPVLGLSSVDAEGIYEIGSGSAVGQFVTAATEFFGVTQPEAVAGNRGQTVDAVYQTAFGENLSGSWGVRPDGRRVVALPASFDPLILDAASNPQIIAYPSNQEERDYVSEALIDRGSFGVAVYSRERGPLEPRRGAGGSFTDTYKVEVAAPVTVVNHLEADNQPEPDDIIFGYVDMAALNQASVVNGEPLTFSVIVTVERALVYLDPELQEIAWYPLPVWKEEEDSVGPDSYPARFFAAEYSRLWSSATPEEVNEANVKTVGARRMYTAWKDRARRILYETYRGMNVANVEWGEWLSDTPTELPVVYAPVESAVAPLPPLVLPETYTADWRAILDLPPAGQDVPTQVPANRLDVRKTLTRPTTGQFAFTAATLGPERERLVWSFRPPQSVMTTSSPGGKRYWCFQLVGYPSVLGGAVNVFFEISPMVTNAPVVYPIEDLSGWTLPASSPATHQGTVEGAALYGPVRFDNLPAWDGSARSDFLTNSRIVLDTGVMRTEFQTGAPAPNRVQRAYTLGQKPAGVQP